MKIAIFSDAFYPAVTSGVVTHTVIMANKLAERGNKIYLFIPRYSKFIDKGLLRKNIKVYYFKGIKMFFSPDFMFTNIITLKDIRLLKDINPDIIYFQTPFTLGLKAITLAKILKKPLIGTLHTHLASKEYLNHLGNITKVIDFEDMGWMYVRYFHNKCDITISPSEYMKRELENHGIKRVVVINNFTDEKALKDRKSKTAIKDNSLVYLGRVSSEKNMNCLLDAWSIVAEKKKDCYLYIIGDGPGLSEAREYITKKRLTGRVFMLGNIDNKIILGTDLLRKFKAFVTMSNSEVQPMSIIEAIFKGLPIIGPRSRGISEMISTNGIAVPKNSSKKMADAMLKILKDKKLQAMMSKESLKISRKYSVDNNVSKMEELFRKTIKDKR